MWGVEAVRVNFWHTWFLELPIWVTPTFSLLALSRTYVTVWNRARVLDVLFLGATLLAGLAISLGLALLIDPFNGMQWVLRALVLAGLSHPAIIASRVIYRVIEEFLSYLNAPNAKASTERVLLYGAGGRCQLYIKERDFNNSASYDGSVIVGLIDDEPTLRAQWIYGYRVLGTSKDLLEIARQHTVRISEWRFSEVPFEPTVCAPVSVNT
jgi:FlaA1/EpsC-like NDP-sugar epimerase